nr:hypothetical protein [Tanacetum cinerariifolium]
MPSCMENLRRKSIWTPSGICGKFESKRSVSFEEILIWTEAVSSSLVWQKYVLDLLAETRMIDCKPVDTPMMVNQKLYMKEKAKLADKGRYLKGTPGHEVLFKANGHLETQVYTDADWAGDKGNQRSTSGYFTLVGGNLVTWRSKKQKVVALSSAEAEF